MPINKYLRGLRPPTPGPVRLGGDSVKTRYAPGAEEKMYAEAVGSPRAKFRRAIAKVGEAEGARPFAGQSKTAGQGGRNNPFARAAALGRAASEGFPGLFKKKGGK